MVAGKLKYFPWSIKFVKLLAGRVGQILEYSGFANELGVDAKTNQKKCFL